MLRLNFLCQTRNMNFSICCHIVNETVQTIYCIKRETALFVVLKEYNMSLPWTDDGQRPGVYLWRDGGDDDAGRTSWYLGGLWINFLLSHWNLYWRPDQFCEFSCPFWAVKCVKKIWQSSRRKNTWKLSRAAVVGLLMAKRNHVLFTVPGEGASAPLLWLWSSGTTCCYWQKSPGGARPSCLSLRCLRL